MSKTMEKRRIGWTWLWWIIFPTAMWEPGPLTWRLTGFLSITLAAFMAYAGYSSNTNFPGEDDLMPISGTISGGVMRYGDYIVVIDGIPYRYLSNAGEVALVRRAARIGATGRVLVRPDAARPANIYALYVNGAPVRTYEDIRAAFKNSDMMFYGLAAAFFLSGAMCFGGAWRVQKDRDAEAEEKRKAEAGVA